MCAISFIQEISPCDDSPVHLISYYPNHGKNTPPKCIIAKSDRMIVWSVSNLILLETGFFSLSETNQLDFFQLTNFDVVSGIVWSLLGDSVRIYTMNGKVYIYSFDEGLADVSKCFYDTLIVTKDEDPTNEEEEEDDFVIDNDLKVIRSLRYFGVVGTFNDLFDIVSYR